MEIITTPTSEKPMPKPAPTILFIAAALAVTALAGTVQAQTDGNTDTAINNTAPMAGANSFTEAQATKRINKAGFTHISGLTKGEDGIWRGTAMKSGTTQNVMLDFKGNVTAQ